MVAIRQDWVSISLNSCTSLQGRPSPKAMKSWKILKDGVNAGSVPENWGSVPPDSSL